MLAEGLTRDGHPLGWPPEGRAGGVFGPDAPGNLKRPPVGAKPIPAHSPRRCRASRHARQSCAWSNSWNQNTRPLCGRWHG
jgi:hypothetical protein